MGMGMGMGCCGVACLGSFCSGTSLPSTITATFSNSGSCTVLDGKSFSLGPAILNVNVGGSLCTVWISALINSPTCPFQLRARCCNAGSTLIFEVENSSVCATWTVSSSTCSPFNVVYNGRTTNIPGGANCLPCNVCLAGGTISVTLTA
jgi:hypothetical protein